MRVLVVFHGWLPGGNRPASGGALRAFQHGEALKHAGHEVLYITRDQDEVEGGPPVFSSSRHLRGYARSVQPDRILCVQPEEAPALANLDIPLCVDFYAPRLLEAVFEENTAEESVRTLRALASADHHLFSNERQRWFYLGLLAMAGVDLRHNSGSVVPLVAPEAPRRRRPKSPLFVMGGVAWPWQDPTEALSTTLKVLNKHRKGKIVVYGGRPIIGNTKVVDLPSSVPASKRLEYRGATSWDKLLNAYSGATAALDVMAPNPEREVALAFRHVEYLACGLPIVTGPTHSLAPAIRDTRSGWVVENGDLAECVKDILAHPEEAWKRGSNALNLSRNFNRDLCEAPLLAWVESANLREKGSAPLPEAAELAAGLAEARGEASHLRTLLDKAEGEVAGKRKEVGRLNRQISTLTSVSDRLSKAIDEVSGFKREAIHVLGADRDAAASELQALHRELADLGADLAKKEAEQRATARERDRAGQDLANALADAAALQIRLDEVASREATLRAEGGRLQAEVDALRAERDRLGAEQTGLQGRVASLSDDIEKKTQELAEVNAEYHRMQDKAGRFESELDRVNRELAALRAENERLSRRRLF